MRLVTPLFRLLTLLIALSFVIDRPAAAQDKLPIVASFSVLADLVQEIGGDRVSVHSLVGPDSDVHVYQPTPIDARTLNRAQLLVTNGLGLEGWIERLVTASGFKGRRVIATTDVPLLLMKIPDEQSRNLKYRSVSDPHAWQSLANAAIYVDNILRGLSEADPANAAYYAARAEAYKKQLAELNAWVKGEIAMVPSDKRRVITTHDAFQYFASAYGVNFIAAEGISTESDPSAQRIAALIAQVRHEHVRALFIENMSDPRLLEQIARDGGAILGGELYADALSATGGPADTYLKMFRHNVTQLKTGMLKN